MQKNNSVFIFTICRCCHDVI